MRSYIENTEIQYNLINTTGKPINSRLNKRKRSETVLLAHSGGRQMVRVGLGISCLKTSSQVV